MSWNLSRTEQTGRRNRDPIEASQQQEREHPMGARAEKAWRAAAACAHRAQAARDGDERDFYVRMRNAWITVGNQSQFAERLDRHDDVARPLPPLESAGKRPAVRLSPA